MPTNILRKSSAKPTSRAPATPTSAVRHAVLTAGRVSIRVELAATPTADLVWNALPLHSTIETWGASIHFETPLEAGRDRTARMLGEAGGLYFWTDEDRIILPFGRTPISKPGELRLPAPCNAIGRALDDAEPLATVTPGEKLALLRA